MRPGLRLTFRAWSFLALGLGLLALGAVSGLVLLVQVGVFLLAVLVVAVVLVLVPVSSRPGSLVVPDRLVAGSSSRVSLPRLGRLLPWSSLVLVLPDAFGGPVSPSSPFVSFTPSARGRFDLGPLVLSRSDPFSLVSRSVVLADPVPVLAVPSALPVPLLASPRGPRDARVFGASVREYRQGDDPRFVHWRASARRGELVVREHEPAPAAGAPLRVVLDVRPSSSFEHLVSLAAGVVVSCDAAGLPFDLFDSAGRDLLRGLPARSSLALDVLATVAPSPLPLSLPAGDLVLVSALVSGSDLPLPSSGVLLGSVPSPLPSSWSALPLSPVLEGVS